MTVPVVTARWLRRLGVGRKPVPADEVRAALVALRGHPCEEAERVLLHYAGRPEAEWRATAFRSLGWWEPLRRGEVLHALRAARQDPDATVRRSALAAAARKIPGARLPVLLQANVAGEEQKSGCEPGEAPAIIERIAALPELALEGLMTMAPLTDDERVQREVFAALRGLRDRLATVSHPLTELSMGMSGDYRAAVAEGSTMLRLGTILFGERTA